jgi:peptidoglycan/xylan/chitin deacetylase (PgdA/CDA1 family)
VATLAAHAAPSVTSVGPLRRRWLPGLSGTGAHGRVALTFDDGPDPASTPAFLDVLDDLGWSATFFMLGSMVRRAPDLAAQVVAAGHEVAVHGDQHRSHLWRSPRDVATDLQRATTAIVEATGRRPVWFRPPYGVLSAGSLVAARRLGLRTVLWTAWGRDWRAAATPDTVVADVDRHLGPGGTVLLHDSDCTSAPGAWRSALGALPALAERFAALDLRPGPLSEHRMARS